MGGRVRGARSLTHLLSTTREFSPLGKSNTRTCSSKWVRKSDSSQGLTQLNLFNSTQPCILTQIFILKNTRMVYFHSSKSDPVSGWPGRSGLPLLPGIQLVYQIQVIFNYSSRTVHGNCSLHRTCARESLAPAAAAAAAPPPSFSVPVGHLTHHLLCPSCRRINHWRGEARSQQR